MIETADSWRGDDAGDVPFDADAQAWFRRVLFSYLFKESKPVGGELSFELEAEGLEAPLYACYDLDAAQMVAAEYMVDARSFVKWEDDDTYRGEGFSNGHWALSPSAIRAFLPAALAAVDRRLDAEQAETLDEWLRLDIDNALCYRGAPSGMSRVAPEIRAAAKARSEQRRKQRTCACGAKFVADRRNAKSCDACRETARRRKRGGA